MSLAYVLEGGSGREGGAVAGYSSDRAILPRNSDPYDSCLGWSGEGLVVAREARPALTFIR